MDSSQLLNCLTPVWSVSHFEKILFLFPLWGVVKPDCQQDKDYCRNNQRNPRGINEQEDDQHAEEKDNRQPAGERITRHLEAGDPRRVRLPELNVGKEDDQPGKDKGDRRDPGDNVEDSCRHNVVQNDGDK